ncbi:hypothetical protein BASA50_006940 [Batrachochytrium salamandrivorans]|uniref:G-protein coupled receptors family 1 profile domain-containing protein n=1 Tax=Batrachochytrium salamandrivorans TaxID=1357716 RepID=A0ABQ8F9R0_9FUNG|nr:hypothetical protein BASA50_006940 [Batrachochytrium salamandrivorans]KAJ1330450.1 hypothetical protein BSLG_009368 [Batrachochytrium salamandrivorans]
MFTIPMPELRYALYAAATVLSFMVAVGNFLMTTSLIIPIIRGSRSGRTLKLALSILNVCSLILQVLVFCSIYGIKMHSGKPVNYLVPPIAAFILGGESWMLLETRFIFNALFTSGPIEYSYWTSQRKVGARLVLAMFHVFLLWPVYLPFFEAPWIDVWMLIGQATHRLLITLVSLIQAYMITTRLVQCHTPESGHHPLRTQHIGLVVLLITTFVIDVAGIIAYTWGSYNMQDPKSPHITLSLLTEQFATTCLGIDVLCETAALIMMVNLVMARQTTATSTKEFEKTTRVVHSNNQLPTPSSVLPHTFRSSMFRPRSDDRRSQYNDSFINRLILCNTS